MRSADALPRVADRAAHPVANGSANGIAFRGAALRLSWLLCAGLTGCASVSSLFKEVPLGGPAVAAAPAQAPTPAPAAVPAAAPTAAAAAAPAATAVAPPAVRAAAAASAPAPGSVSTTLPLVYSGDADRSDKPVTAAAQRTYDEARRQMRAGNVAEAERGFRALVLSNPELGGPHANLGVIYRQANKLAEAVAAGEKAVQASPKQPLFFNQLAITYRQNGQFAKAREAYEAAIALDPAYAAPYLNLGILHDLYFGDGKRALELYDKYLSLSPGGDAVVAKWVADLKNRKPTPVTVSQKEKE
jgi:Flp pilus assembly protein TadD